MKQIKYMIVAVIYCLCAISNSYAASEAEFIKLEKEYTFKPDGSVEFHYTKILKLNTHMAFNRLYGETFVVYNPVFQKIKINASYTEQAGGNRVETPGNAFNEVLPAMAADAPAYNNLKEMVITHTGLEIGAVINLDYTVYTKGGYGESPDIDEILQELSPVKEYVITIHVPENQELNYVLTGVSAKPVVSHREGMKQYRWVLKNIPAYSQEAFQVVGSSTVPRLMACGYTSQEQALKVLKNKLDIRLNDEGMALSRDLIRGLTTDKDKVLAIQQYVVDRVATIEGISLENAGYKLRVPDEVLHGAYGTELEKTALFMAMLESVGFNPELVVVFPNIWKGAVKGLKSIQDLKVKIDVGDSSFVLSAVNEASESMRLRGDRDERWVLSEKEIGLLSVTESKGVLEYKVNVSLDSSKAVTKGDVEIKGGILPRLNDEVMESRVKAYAAPFGKSRTTEVTLGWMDNRMHFETEQTLLSQDNYIIYRLPVSDKGVNGWKMAILNSVRKTPLEIPYKFREVYDYTIVLESGMTLRTSDQELTLKNKVGNMSVSIRQSGDIVEVHKELEFTKACIEPSEYQDFRELVTNWYTPEFENIVLSTK